jgi:hypothetical protein
MSAQISYTGRQAVRTRYLGATNYKPSRIVAECEAGRIVVSWDYELNVHDNHAAACAALLKKMDWPQSMTGGGFKGGAMFWVCDAGKSSGRGYAADVAGERAE